MDEPYNDDDFLEPQGTGTQSCTASEISEPRRRGAFPHHHDAHRGRLPHTRSRLSQAVSTGADTLASIVTYPKPPAREMILDASHAISRSHMRSFACTRVSSFGQDSSKHALPATFTMDGIRLEGVRHTRAMSAQNRFAE